jgi:4-hydroxybenzoate polyprenyltransferase/phosphoserine phosphatase
VQHVKEVEAAAEARTPLAVDLDGTLIHADLFVEGALRYILQGPFNIFRLIGWLLGGRAAAKAAVAAATPCDPTLLPYDQRIVAWLGEERRAGRTIVLATAADNSEANRVAEHLGVFDQVIASDGEVNLKAQRKAERLGAMFPEGFVYAGNERADVTVWSASEAIVIANASKSLERSAEKRFDTEKVFAAPGGALRALVKAIRPQQWAKNVLVFVPMLAGHGWLDATAWRGAMLAFLALSATASSVYLVNDAADIDADRRHHRKRNRPFASGRLSPLVGLVASGVLLCTGLGLAYLGGVLPWVAFYLACSTTYTFWLKRKMLVDVFLLASLYMTRILIGGVAASSGVHSYLASSWLLAFSCFFFLSLALMKRVIEIDTVAASGGAGLSKRGYLATDGKILSAMGIASGFASALVLALYLQSSIVAANYRNPFLLWVLPAAIVYWQCRTWLKADRGDVHDDPLVYAMRDRISWAVGAVVAAAFLAAMVAPPGLIPGS